MPTYLRNVKTTEIKAVEPDSEQFAKLVAERGEDGRPLYEQVGSHTAGITQAEETVQEPDEKPAKKGK